MIKVFCISCQKHTKNKNPKNSGTSNGRIMFSAHCSLCNSKKIGKDKKQVNY